MQLSQGQDRQPLSPEGAPPPCVDGSGVLLVDTRAVVERTLCLPPCQGKIVTFYKAVSLL
jgi:hypothetical protein